MSRTRILTLLALLLVVLAPLGAQQQAPRRPKLVVVLSIDQMRFDYLTRFAPLYTGGLKTIREHGAIFSNANYRHSATETGPGHGVILSGRHPSHSGIVANDWWDPFLRKWVNVVDDPAQTALGGIGRAASPANALSVTVGDVLKTKSPESHVVGVSLKDRSAILMGGRRADGAYWYETAQGRFVTSTYYMKAVPSWLTAWNNQRLADRYSGKKWERLLSDRSVYEKYAGPDAIEGEWDREDTVFPHFVRSIPPDPAYYDDLRRTPFADELTLSVALEAMKAYELGQNAATDIFAVGFSGTDIVGHTYGPDSQEIMDQLLRLDRVLDQLFKEIDRTVGMADTLVVMTADHGVLPLVENLQAQGLDARRGSPNVLEKAIRTAFAKRFPKVDGLIAYFATDVYLDDAVIRDHHLDRHEVEQVAVDALMSTGLVEHVYTREDLLAVGSSSDPYLRLFQNAFFEPRSPDLNVLPRKYYYLSNLPGGTGHGTPYEYDRHVPVAFMGPGIKPGEYSQPCGPEDIAPTLAKILGLDFPREDDSRLLSEMLQ